MSYKSLQNIHGLIKELEVPLKGRKQSLKNKKVTGEMDYPIDFVVTWVDGNDPEWLNEKAKYIKDKNKGEGTITARYREWGIFMYWFRMVELYAPWVNKVYLLTWGHVPSWLNKKCSKLVVVKHEDYIPHEYLPTFNSIPIELNIGRIKGLSEHFVYFNDDMFLTKPVQPADFFIDGIPKYVAITEPLKSYGIDGFFQHELFSNLGLINRKFNLKECMNKCPEKWFSYIYEDDLRYNFQSYLDGFLPGMHFTHLATPYRKSTFNKVWEEYFERLDSTCKHKFREPLDIMHQIVQLWDMCEGNFIPVPRGYYGHAPVNMSKKAVDSVIDGKYIFVCLNDSERISENDYLELKRYCAERLEDKFPNKSQFEI